MQNSLSLFLNGEAATEVFGSRIAPDLAVPLAVWLEGDLGAGKTTLVRAILRRLGHAGAVKSPTYAIVESYRPNGLAVNHFDLYRFAEPEEWHDAGLDDLTGAGCICLIEWAEKGGGNVPAADIYLDFTAKDNGRYCTVRTATARGESVLAQ